MNKRKLSLLFSLFGLTLLVGGVVLLLSGVRSKVGGIVTPPPTKSAIQAQAHPALQAPVTSGAPATLSIPNLNLSIAITPGVYNPVTKTWTLTLDKVQYAVMTPPPNTSGGNTFLYGHYRNGVFATLHTIKPGSEAIITTDNGHIFYYQLAGSRVVSPTDSSSVFNYQGPPILTLQTCTGAFFQNRQLFTFNLERAV